MPISFNCTNSSCNKRLKADEQHAGKRIKCPGCGTVQVVPAPEGDLVPRFFGSEVAPAPHQFRLVANPAIENPLSLQVLFAQKPRLDPQALTAALRSYHPRMAKGLFEVDPQLAAQGTPLGLAGW